MTTLVLDAEPTIVDLMIDEEKLIVDLEDGSPLIIPLTGIHVSCMARSQNAKTGSY